MMKKLIKSAYTLIIILFSYTAVAQNKEAQNSNVISLPDARIKAANMANNDEQINSQNATEVSSTPEGMQKMKPAIPIKDDDNKKNTSSATTDVAQPQPASLIFEKTKQSDNSNKPKN